MTLQLKDTLASVGSGMKVSFVHECDSVCPSEAFVLLSTITYKQREATLGFQMCSLRQVVMKRRRIVESYTGPTYARNATTSLCEAKWQQNTCDNLEVRRAFGSSLTNEEQAGMQGQWQLESPAKRVFGTSLNAVTMTLTATHTMMKRGLRRREEAETWGRVLQKHFQEGR